MKKKKSYVTLRKNVFLLRGGNGPFRAINNSSSVIRNADRNCPCAGTCASLLPNRGV